MSNVQGKRVLVTGASRGVGFGVAKAFAAAGAEVVATGRNEERLRKLRDEIAAAGGKAIIIPADLSTRDAARGVARDAGEIDVLINNAAVTTSPLSSALLEDDAGWDLQFAVNTIGPVTLMQALIPGMMKRGNGTVINISSIAARRPSSNLPHYAASKAAMEVASRSIAIEVAGHGVSVNCIELGLTRTEAMDDMFALGFFGAAPSLEAIERMNGPAGRVTQISEVAEFCLFLASDKAGTLTGTVIPLDAGTTAGNFVRRAVQ